MVLVAKPPANAHSRAHAAAKQVAAKQVAVDPTSRQVAAKQVAAKQVAAVALPLRLLLAGLDPPSRQVAVLSPLQLRMLSRVRVQRYTTQKDTLA